MTKKMQLTKRIYLCLISLIHLYCNFDYITTVSKGLCQLYTLTYEKANKKANNANVTFL